MPFDPMSPARDPAAGRRDRHLVAGWLFLMCGMILVMVTLGGVTRLTGSGLSIMEWAPLSGALPPLGHDEWQRLLDLYRTIPQAHLLHPDMDLSGFQRIFWLEYVHRLWGRLLGIAFLVPLGLLLWRGAIPRALAPRLILLFVLGGLQGAVGWFLVASGFFPDSVAVSAYRLVVHLTLALALYAALLWTGLSLLLSLPPSGDGRGEGLAAAKVLRARAPSPPPSPEGGRGSLRIFVLLAVSVALTIVAGGVVAGLHAGLAYNTFPLMDGRLIPEGYAALTPLWRNLTENVAAAQFDHRLLATLTALLAAIAVVAGWRASRPGQALRAAVAGLGAMVAVQYALGIATLVFVVPTGLAAAHQACAVLVLSAALVCLHMSRHRAAHRPQEFS